MLDKTIDTEKLRNQFPLDPENLLTDTTTRITIMLLCEILDELRDARKVREAPPSFSRDPDAPVYYTAGPNEVQTALSPMAGSDRITKPREADGGKLDDVIIGADKRIGSADRRGPFDQSYVGHLRRGVLSGPTPQGRRVDDKFIIATRTTGSR